jgi:Holliday junction DNA helicase RuvA
MIERLTGVCVHKSAASAVIDVNGVGYGVEMTEAALLSLPLSDAPVTIWVYTLVREEALRLFGFLTFDERAMFLMLLEVSKVGPKHALSILGRMDLSTIMRAADQEDANAFKAVPGIGEELAKRLALEMKRKTKKLLARGFQVQEPVLNPGASAVFEARRASALDRTVLDDLRSALENFGYKGKELEPLLMRYGKRPPSRELSELMRLALAELTGTARNGAAKPLLEETF